MMRRYSFPKRIIAMLLSIVMVMSFMPSLGISAQAAAGSAIADAGTMDDWKSFFDPDNVSTEHAGGIWTDKSVFTDNSAFPAGTVTVPGTDHFLVALSALGSNSIVVGQGTKPTDTVFVLDVSGSMNDTSGAVSNMVKAANDAIRSLMAANEENRVGVVLYSSSATTLLPLDHYTGVTWTQTNQEYYFIATSDSNGGGGGGGGNSTSITTNIPTSTTSSGGGGCEGGGGQTQTETRRATGSDGNQVSSVTRQVTGGTYIQGGLWEAWENHFNTAADTTSRTPSIVLMSDGAPTYNSSAFDNVDEDNYTHGAGNNSFAGDGFVTQLTAAVVKANVANKYQSQAYMYTIGFGLDAISGTRNKGVATAVLDPTDSPYEDITNYWTTYKALATTSSTMNVGLGINQGQNDTTENVTISKSSVDLFNGTYYKSGENYVDKFFSADDASDLSSVFQNIVNEINLQAGYYPTRLDDNGTNFSGYVSFVDEIGTGMEVEHVHGILVGDTLYTGEQIARILWNTDQNNTILKNMNGGVLPTQMTAEMEAALKYSMWLGTRYQPTALGDEFVWAVMQRIGIEAPVDADGNPVLNSEGNPITARDRAWELIGNAWRDGQLSCTVDANGNVTEYSNYIGWYGDASGNYLGPWDKDGDVAVPEGAEYINMCYGMLGTTTASSLASDMMYVTVQVSHKITTDEQIVTFRIPASLLPTVTYRVNVTLNDNNQIVEDDNATIEYVAADPIRLVYEVGVNEDIVNEITIAQYGTPAPAGSADEGKYYLYTNQWHAAATGDTANDHIAYSYFESSEENEHYYFTEDTPVYTYDGTNYTLATSYDANTTYYYAHRTYVVDPDVTDSDTTDNAYPAKINVRYGVIDPAVVLAAHENGNYDNGNLYIAKGTVRKNLHDHDAAKSENKTGTFSEVRKQMVSDLVAQSAEEHHYELTYLGNNGRLTYEPATGISLTKNVDTTITDDTLEYVFDIALTNAGGNPVSGTFTLTTPAGSSDLVFTNGKAQVTLKAGDTVYIHGLPEGTVYSITEQYSDDFKISSATNNGTGIVVPNTLQSVVFTNTARGTGNLIIGKDVANHPFTPEQIAEVEFTFTVTLTRENNTPYAGQTLTTNGTGTYVTDDNGQVEIILHDNESITISNLPAGVRYTVTEAEAKGYTTTATGENGTIADGQTATAHFVNTYTVGDAVKTNLQVQINKTLTTSGDSPLTDTAFYFLIERLNANGTDYESAVVEDIVVSTAGPNGTVTVDLSNQTYDHVGTYTYRVTEFIPDGETALNGTVYDPISGMTYDSRRFTFTVVVTDPLKNGDLVATVDTVNYVVNGSFAANAEVPTFVADFTNVYDVGATTVSFDIKKTLSDTYGVDIPMANFQFGLYTDEACTTLAPLDRNTFIPGPRGNVDVDLHITTEGTVTYYLKEIAGSIPGMSYDDTVYTVTIVTNKVTNADNTTELQSTVTLTSDAGKSQATTSNDGQFVANFSNTYTVKETTPDLVISGEKILNGRQWLSTDSFTFELYQTDAAFVLADNAVAIDTDSVSLDGKTFSFDGMTFNRVATYYYIVKEQIPADAVSNKKDGITYDTTEYHITVDVTLQEGTDQLVADVTVVRMGNGTVESDALDFTNTYTADPTGDIFISAGKLLQNLTPTVNGVPLPDLALTAGQFQFTLEIKDAQGNVVTSETVSNDSSGGITFSAVTFGTAGVYTYTITEAPGTNPNINYNAEGLSGSFEVKDDGAGQLYVDDVTIEAGTIVNSYSADDTTLDMTASKHLAGRPQKPGEFTFTLTGPNGAMPEGVTGTTVDASNAAGGAINFGTITYTAAGEYQYTIVENKPEGYEADANGLYKGVKYDENTYNITVTVEDKLDGTLYAYVSKVEVGNTETTLDIHNRYEIHDSETVTLGGSKVVNDTTSETPKTAGDFEFSFVLKNENGDVLETVTNDGGSFAFTAKTYTAPAKEVYWIEELANGIPGMTYDATKYKVTITITDDGVGGLNQSVVYEKLKVDAEGNPVTDDLGNYTFDAADSADFVNGYAAEAAEPITITGYKKFPGGRDIVDGEFQFILTKPDGATETKGNVGYIFTFDPITYTVEGTYVYTLVEKLEGIEVDADGNYIKDGVKYDPTEFTITVTVTDVNGKLTTSTAVTQTGGTENLTEYGFTNVFIPEAVSTTIEVKKLLENLSDEAMGLDGFVFELYRVDTEETKTASSDADGKASFQLSFTGADVGKTYEYRLSEDDSADVEGMDYDNTVYTIFITVNQNSTTGALSLDVKCGNEALTGALEFENTYDPPVPPTTTEEEPPTTTEEEPPTTTEEEPPSTSEEAPPTTEEDPSASEPETSEPETSEPETSEPETSEPETSEPETSDPGDSTDPTGGNDDGDKDPTDDGKDNNGDEPPKTMDETDLIGWTMMMSVSAICLLAVLVLGKKLVFETA